jgi:Asp-tRNA(Asn)/Glu-tRNA(Gln) amidotransferase A subunit family amidase
MNETIRCQPAHPHEMTACQAIAAIQCRDISVTELIQSCVAHIERTEPSVKAWAYLDAERILSQAKLVDIRLARGEAIGPLSGIPIGIKDVFNTMDMPTSMGSPIWKNFTPGNDSRVVASLRFSGGLIMGKTVTAEFAVHHPGLTLNPHNNEYSPGTSSSGSAAAVAARMVPIALGTQTAGSTIRPASYCGVYALKPSFGVVPRTGILKTLDTLDHVAFLARDPNDLELVFDSSRVSGPNHPFVYKNIDQGTPHDMATPIRVALVRGPVWDQAEEYAQKAFLKLAEKWGNDSDFIIEDISLPPLFQSAHDLHEVIYSKALSYYFSKEYDEHYSKLSPSFRQMVERGKSIGPESYLEGLRKQQTLKKTLDLFFKDFDVILNLATAGIAPLAFHGEEKMDCCLIWTMCHVPVMSIPVFRHSSGMPFGVQLVAPRYKDRLLFEVVKKLQSKDLIREWDQDHKASANSF